MAHSKAPRAVKRKGAPPVKRDGMAVWLTSDDLSLIGKLQQKLNFPGLGTAAVIRVVLNRVAEQEQIATT